jgi:hypothetical protein
VRLPSIVSLCYSRGIKILDHASVSYLSMSKNGIGREAGMAIAEALKINETITNIEYVVQQHASFVFMTARVPVVTAVKVVDWSSALRVNSADHSTAYLSVSTNVCAYRAGCMTIVWAKPQRLQSQHLAAEWWFRASEQPEPHHSYNLNCL